LSSTTFDGGTIYLDNSKLLIFNDARRFGMIHALPTKSLEQEFFHNLGVEPLSDNLSSEYLITKLANRNVPIKNLIMDNKIIVGIGNIYASETLFAARIDPRRLGSSLQDAEITGLILAIKNILSKAILAGGTSVKNFVSGDSKPGYFQQELQVYARENQQCLICQGLITKIKQSARASFYCAICQNREC
jgi:formamidopyrimidine-DNA glycosylase